LHNIFNKFQDCNDTKNEIFVKIEQLNHARKELLHLQNKEAIKKKKLI